ncbi:hypothetical protein B0H21DRAFT_98874 [Amylocystis lapponica]|nr:hypothetical protein B0H21DRAFT_98874 [Amylocystis lapponica]
MIILDEADDPHIQSKVASETTLTSRTVRPTTPTPSLPDYESSQSISSSSSSASHSSRAQLTAVESAEPPVNRWWPKHRSARVRRVVLYALVIYFFFTVAVGVPIIVVKMQHRWYERQIVAQDTSAMISSPSLLIIDGETPLAQGSNVSCNAWVDMDVPLSDLMRADLQYVIPLSGPIFLQSNVSYYEENDLSQQVSGTLNVDVNDDPAATDAVVSVSMFYSVASIRMDTSVCLVNLSGSNGIYIYGPHTVQWPETLMFNISLLLPQTPDLFISKLVTMLPRFSQQYGPLASSVLFGNVELGGPLSKVMIDSLSAGTAVIKSPLAEISGQFDITQALVLDTVSAPITANISLHNSGSLAQVTYLELSTGNSPLTANVTLYFPYGSPPAYKAPNFLAKAQTFNGPLNLTIAHAPSSAPAALQLQAENALGEVLVSVDSKFAGTFDVTTTYASAQVLMPDVLSENGTQYDLGLYTPSSSAAAPSSSFTRAVDFDVISSSRMAGWVGFGPRPPSPQKYHANGQGRIEVESTLTPVTLLLGS